MLNCLKMNSSCLLVMFVATVMAQNDLSVDCSSGVVTVSWRPRLGFSEKLDLSRALLGNCPPSFLGSDESLRFYVSLRECGFHKQVSVNRVMYSSVLMYDRGPGLSISQSLRCIYDLPSDKTTAFSPEDEELDEAEEITFSMELMNRCLMENSTFLPRLLPAEVRLYLEAFEFALGEKIFLHCDLMAKDIRSVMVDGKACHYMKERRRWELLDDPSQSFVCLCCESTCPWGTDTPNGVSAHKVLGPFIIVEDKSERSLYSQVSKGLIESPVWLFVTLVTLLLVAVTGVLAVSYYLCVWRGGRVGYRPRRDLLWKY